jgi:hypothetical protein
MPQSSDSGSDEITVNVSGKPYRMKIDRAQEDMARLRASERRDARRPLARHALIRELVEVQDPGTEDGQYLHELFEIMKDELSALMMLDKADKSAIRELSFIMAKVDEARGWALEYGIKKKSLYVLDRRRFRSDENDTSKGSGTHDTASDSDNGRDCNSSCTPRDT